MNHLHRAACSCLLSPVFCLLLLAQDKPPEERTLEWKLAEGQKFTISWRNAAKAKVTAGGQTILAYDFTAAMSGKLSVSSIARGGKTECLLSVRRHELKGTAQGADVHFLMEDGQLKKSVGVESRSAEDLPKVANRPIWLKVTPQGTYECEGSDDVNKFFGGLDGLIGPLLPEGSVKVGDSWPAALHLAGSSKLGAVRLTGRYKFAGLEKEAGAECARITMDEKQDAMLSGVKVRHEIKRDALFDVAAGRCVRSRISWKASGAGEAKGQQGSVDLELSVEFDLMPVGK